MHPAKWRWRRFAELNMKTVAHLLTAIVFLISALPAFPSVIPHKKDKEKPSALDQYVKDADTRATEEGEAVTPGSAWSGYSNMMDLTRDLRASRVDDVVTVIVAESASANTTGNTKSSRKSSANAAITGLPGIKGAAVTAALSNLAKMSSDTELSGQGSTNRSTTLTTNMTGRVARVLPNGFLLIEGSKNVQINSEWQVVTLRGVVRPADLTADNTVASQRIAQMEVKLDGKGVVNDAIRRPNYLYRLLLGLLPF
jgi:flagellar L-ring protein FlgH